MAAAFGHMNEKINGAIQTKLSNPGTQNTIKFQINKEGTCPN
jgi:hypothetical protein